jgi:hypothetical protein
MLELIGLSVGHSSTHYADGLAEVGDFVGDLLFPVPHILDKEESHFDLLAGFCVGGSKSNVKEVLVFHILIFGFLVGF